MKFNRPCLICGALSPETRCPTHDREYRARRQAIRDANPIRRERKKELYNSDYQKKRKAIGEWVREYGATCHICNKPIPPGSSIQIDHLDAGSPDSPLAPAHPFCNQSRGSKPL